MAYTGKYTIKNKSKYKGDHSNVVYRSLWEKAVFNWCDHNPSILYWQSEETVVPYYYDVDKKYHRYFVDLKIKYKDGKVILVEIKPKGQTEPPKQGSRKTKRFISEAMAYVKNMNKWEAADNYAKDRNWQFQIWTEDTLHEMGIMRKKTLGKKRIKPLKKL
jgi:hypothetical protein